MCLWLSAAIKFHKARPFPAVFVLQRQTHWSPAVKIINWSYSILFIAFGAIQLIEFFTKARNYYFSEYIGADWHRVGYLLYGLIILTTLLYEKTLVLSEKYIPALLQTICLMLLLLVAANDPSSRNHIFYFTFLFLLQPLVFFFDATPSLDLGGAEYKLMALGGLFFAVALGFLTIGSGMNPSFEKCMIAILFGVAWKRAIVNQSAYKKLFPTAGKEYSQQRPPAPRK